MRDMDRIERILNKIKKIWYEYPDLRLGQLLMNVNKYFEGNTFYHEDNELESALDDFISLYLGTIND